MSFYGDAWADLYDRVHTLKEDIPFWVREAKSCGGPVLELGCGTGRVTIPVAQAGVPITGVDNSPAMLSKARAGARKLGLAKEMLKFRLGDMRDFRLGQKFPLVIVPYRSFQLLLSVADQRQALENIKRHLAAEGRLIIDLFVPDQERLIRESSSPVFRRKIVDGATGRRLRVSEQNQHDPFGQIINARTILEEVDVEGGRTDRREVAYQLRYLYRFEAMHLLEAAGYRVVELYGDFNRGPFDEASSEMIWVVAPV